MSVFGDKNKDEENMETIGKMLFGTDQIASKLLLPTKMSNIFGKFVEEDSLIFRNIIEIINNNQGTNEIKIAKIEKTVSNHRKKMKTKLEGLLGDIE